MYISHLSHGSYICELRVPCISLTSLMEVTSGTVCAIYLSHLSHGSYICELLGVPYISLTSLMEVTSVNYLCHISLSPVSWKLHLRTVGCAIYLSHLSHGSYICELFVPHISLTCLMEVTSANCLCHISLSPLSWK